MEPADGRAPTRSSVRLLEPISVLFVRSREESRQVGGATGGQRSVEALLDAVEEMRVPLGAEECPEELATRPGVVAQAGAVALEPADLPRWVRFPVAPFEEADRDVAVPNAAHELAQPAQARVKRAEQLPIPSGEQLLPDGEADAEPAEIAMEAVQAFRGGVRRLQHLVDRAEHVAEQPIELRDQGGRSRRATCGPRRHARPPASRPL